MTRRTIFRNSHLFRLRLTRKNADYHRKCRVILTEILNFTRNSHLFSLSLSKKVPISDVRNIFHRENFKITTKWHLFAIRLTLKDVIWGRYVQSL